MNLSRKAMFDEMGISPCWVLREQPSVAREAPRTTRREAVAGPAAVVQAPASPVAIPPAAPSDAVAGMDWDSLNRTIRECRICGLCAGRKQAVPGVGDENADWLFIGEGPGRNEDEQGLPFVGRSGKLLDQYLEAVDLSRDKNVFIGNIVKCRPPGNRVPTPEEMEGCIPYLKRQIAVIQPKLIVCLGATAARGLVNETLPIGKARGQWREFEGIPVMLTFHPAYLLRDPRQKAPCWADLKTVLARLGKQPPAKDV